MPYRGSPRGQNVHTEEQANAGNNPRRTARELSKAHYPRAEHATQISGSLQTAVSAGQHAERHIPHLPEETRRRLDRARRGGSGAVLPSSRPVRPCAIEYRAFGYHAGRSLTDARSINMARAVWLRRASGYVRAGLWPRSSWTLKRGSASSSRRLGERHLLVGELPDLRGD